MSRIGVVSLSLIALAVIVFGQTPTYPYYLKNFAGAFPLGDGGPATSALLYNPYAAAADTAGNLYILDSNNYRIRKVAPDGKISTYAQINLYGYDLKMAFDGTLYVAGEARVIKISPSGTPTVVAGTGNYGYSGDGGPATSAQVGTASGVVLDGAGNFYFSDYSFPSNRVRMVTTDGKIKTIAGSGGYTFNGDNQLATSANLYFPKGVAVDSSGSVYVADSYNYRIRKFTVGGNITTIAGNGSNGPPVDGPATGRIGIPSGLWIDASNNLYATDAEYGAVMKIAPDGTMKRVAGNLSPYSVPGDGVATSVSLLSPWNVSMDKSGNLLIAEYSHRIRKVTPDGNLTTIAGMVHFGGDSDLAVSAILNQPSGLALDGQGNLFIADGYNYRIRKVTPDGTISTIAGTGIPGVPSNGAQATNAAVPYINAMTADGQGNLYIASNYQALKIGTDGIVSVIAGTGANGNGGDGALATAATFRGITGIAVDNSGNVYLADGYANRIRMVAADTGIVTAFAGTGSRGSLGDGALATSASLNLYGYPAPLAVDKKGNVYIGDGQNYKVRMVSEGLISTVVGNGSLGLPDGSQAASSPFPGALSMAFDAAGNLYIAADYGGTYRLSGGVIRRISGNANNVLVDGTPALSVNFFGTDIKVDGNGDIYAADSENNAIRKLMVNSPSSFVSADGDKQSGQVGQALVRPLKVQLLGRLGFAISGMTVTFAVTSGDATLTATNTQTDGTGSAGVGLVLGNAGNVVVTATVPGTSLPVVQFTATALPICSVAIPKVISANSAGDFGGSTAFAPGSWLEIKGTNLAQSTRLWSGADFKGPSAPTVLDGVSVTINGKPAIVEYVSPGQLNVQAPADATTGPVQLVVATASSASCESVPFTIQEAAVAPGLLAPTSFNIGGKQYLVALFSDGVTYVGNPNLIRGVPFRPAAPGDIITAYGIGFGDVSPAAPPGYIVGGANTLPNLTISFGETPSNVAYAGLAPGTVGEYQFAFTVPTVSDGDYAVTFQLGSTKVSQSLYLTVHR